MRIERRLEAVKETFQRQGFDEVGRRFMAG
jgi:hypothetical protein